MSPSKMGSLRAPVSTGSSPPRQVGTMGTIIRDAFQASQDSTSCHPKLVKKLRKCYESVNDPDKFFDTFIRYLRYPISGVTERTGYIDRTLDFCAKFACCFIVTKEDKTNGDADDKEKNGDANGHDAPEDDEEEEEELPIFIYRLFTWLLDHHEVQGSDTRLRVCQLLNKLLKYMGEEACIDDDLYNKIYDGMLERLKDRVADIRSQAVTALQRLQDPRDEECPIIKAYLFHLAHDPNNIVRRTIVRCIGATRVTLPHILERTRDTDEHVRRAAYKFLSEKVHIKSLTIGQREGVLQRGLGDRGEAVRNIVKKEMIPAWVKLSGHNIVQLLHHLDVGNSDQEHGPKKVQPACVGTLEVLFADSPPHQLVTDFQYLNEEKTIPFDKLTAETALYWRCLVKFIDELPDKDENKEDLMEKLIPELTVFCNYIRRYILDLAKEDEDNHWEFVAIELIRMTAHFDIKDEVGRRNLVKLVRDLLGSNKTPISFIPHLVEVFARVEENTQSRIEQIAEIISELKDPICDEVEMSPGSVTIGAPGSSVMPTPCPSSSVHPTPARVDTITEDEKQKKQIEIAQIRVQINIKKDELDAACEEQDFAAAQLIKIQLDQLDSAQAGLHLQLAAAGEALAPTPCTAGPNPTPATVLITPATGANVNPGAILDLSDSGDASDKPAVVYKCLKLIVSTLQDTKIQSLNNVLQMLMDEFIVLSIQSELDYIRKEAINALTCCCLRSIDMSRQHLLLLLQAAHIDVGEVRIAAVTAVVDLLMKHGLAAFITNTTPEPEDQCDTSETASRADSNIESALDSDMAMRGATLTQSELNNQGGNSVVAILSKILDEPDLELRTEVAEGLCKLLMIGAISSPKLLSRLILIWYNPMTESESKLRHILGTFFPLYCSMSRGHQEALRQAFLPTMKILFDAPVTSPMSEIDTEDVGMFIINLTSESCLQSFDKDKKEDHSVEDTSDTTVHDELVFPICNEILSAPDAFQCKVLIKHLTNLHLTPNNYTNLRSIRTLTIQLLDKVKEKACVKSLEKFKLNLESWLAKDPANCLNVEGENKRDHEASEETASSGNVSGSPDKLSEETPKKRKVLFSQSIHGQALLHPDDGENMSASSGDETVFTNNSGVIPSPVVNTSKNTTRLETSPTGEKEKGSVSDKGSAVSDKDVDDEVTISGSYFSEIMTAKTGKERSPEKEKSALSAGDLTGIQDVFQSTQVGGNMSANKSGNATTDTEDEDQSENENVAKNRNQSDKEETEIVSGAIVSEASPPKKKGKKKATPITVIPPSDDEDETEAKPKGRKKKKASPIKVIPMSDTEEDEGSNNDDMFSDASSVASVTSRLPSTSIMDGSSTEEEEDIFARDESPEDEKKGKKGKKTATVVKKKKQDDEDIEDTPVIVNKNLSLRAGGRVSRRGQSDSESTSDVSSVGASPSIRGSRKVEETPVSSNRSSRSSVGASPVMGKKTKGLKPDTSPTPSTRSTRNNSPTPSNTSVTSTRSTRNSPAPSSAKPEAAQKKKAPAKKTKDDVVEETGRPGRKRNVPPPTASGASSPSTASPVIKKKLTVNLNVNGSSKKAAEAVKRGKMSSVASNSSDDFVEATPQANKKRTSAGAKANATKGGGKKK